MRNRSLLKNFKGRTGDDLSSTLQSSLYDTESQLNSGTEVTGITGNRIPKGQRAGDITGRFGPDGFIIIGIADALGNRREVAIPMGMAPSADAITSVPTGGSATAAANATAINSILDLLRSIRLIQS